MNPISEDSMSHPRRIGAISLFVFLSLVLPLTVMAWGVMTALGGKPLGYNLAEYKDFELGVLTPGKWLLGIRTVRSTLRPCEITRALVRDALYGLDVLFFVTAIPAAISMMLSRNSQRLGDRLADTVVVTVASLNESPRQDDRNGLD